MFKKLVISIFIFISSCNAYYSDALNCYTETVMNCRAIYGNPANFNQKEYQLCDTSARELCCILYPDGSCYKR